MTAVPLARAMALAADRYYATREPFGPAGDFVTAPEISQMFGELLGAWVADLWQRAGSPARTLLVELGPGRGTLMADVLRTLAKLAPDLQADVHLVERSPRLRAEQARKLRATWHDSLDTLPADAPLICLANEFFDALPLTQFERTASGWAVRAVDAGAWDLSIEANAAVIPEPLRDAPPGAVYERSFAGEAVAAALGRRLAAQGGAALIIDYGYAGPALGDTLQAIRTGEFADPLATMGDADLSAHVDFSVLAAAAGRAGAAVFGPVDQGPLLAALGIHARADALKALASVPRRAEVAAAATRLTAAGAMGRLFKALALVAPGWPHPAGFPMVRA
jgi:NADH dehydrogenase [ubiquinone] 1 alpha subcomplex assembly factor 7